MGARSLPLHEVHSPLRPCRSACSRTAAADAALPLPHPAWLPAFLFVCANREAVASGMDWDDLGRMIKEERRAGNPVAALIHSLQLDRSRVTLLLRCGGAVVLWC